jgi:DNA-binding PadR family transcriptional regulator
MSEGLTEFQKRLLRFLREETARLDGSACYLDSFFERLSPNQTMKGKGFFLKELNNLEHKGFIETTRFGYTKRKGMKFNCYKITEKGLKAIEEN